MKSVTRCPRCQARIDYPTAEQKFCAKCEPIPVASPAATAPEARRLPTIEVYVLAGYKADTYDAFIAQAKAMAAEEGFTTVISEATPEELAKIQQHAKQMAEYEAEYAKLEAEKAALEKSVITPPAPEVAPQAGQLDAQVEETNSHDAPTPPAAPSSPRRASAPTRNLHAVAQPEKKKK